MPDIKSPTISVIVPIYNAEKYLRRCLDSILAQSYTGFELIAVNDGSTDGSGQICDEYERADSRVKVIHKANGGVSSARNAGIRAASGVYVIQIDADDYIDQGYFQDAFANLDQKAIDVIWFDYWLDRAGQPPILVNQKNQESKNACVDSILSGSLHGGMWNKFVRKDLFLNNGILFPEDIVMCEDLLVSVLLFHSSKNVKYRNSAFLHYVQNSDSAVNTKGAKYMASLNQVLTRLRGIDPNFGSQNSLQCFQLSVYAEEMRAGVFVRGRELSKGFVYTLFTSTRLAMADKIAVFFGYYGAKNISKFLFYVSDSYRDLKVFARRCYYHCCGG